MSVAVLDAQPQWQSYFAVSGGGSWLQNRSTLPILFGNPACGTFADGTAVGWWGSVEWGYRIGRLPLFFSVVGRYHQKPAQLQARQQSFEVWNPITEQYEPLVLEYQYRSVLHYLMMDVGIQYQLPLPIDAAIRIGMDAGMPLLGTAFETYEAIVSPAGVYFPDSTRRHLLQSGEIPQTGTSYGVTTQFAVAVSLGSAVVAQTLVGYRYGLNSVLRDADWRIHHFFAGIGLQYRLFDTPSRPRKAPSLPPSQPEEVPSLPPAFSPPPVIAQLTVQPLTLTQTVVTETFPLLPYIFFDSASAVLPQRYQWLPEDKEHFTEQQLPRQMMPIYYALLSIIGKRMQQMPETKLRIIGIARPDEVADERRREALARQRAAAVADFLMSHWNISPARLQVRWQTQPRFATSEVYPEGRQENRRVEIVADDPLLLAPVVHHQFFEYAAKDSLLSISTDVHPEGIEVRQWTVTIEQEHQPLMVWTGQRWSPLLQVGLNKAVIQQIGGNPEQVAVRVQIHTSSGTQTTATQPLPVRIVRDTIEIRRLSLIVFDFDQYQLTPENKVILQHFVQQAITPQSAIRIVGSTDRLGELDYNIELSRRRAETVAEFLRRFPNVGHFVEVKGIGPSRLLYDNSLPEGRYYCRTVLIEVKNPLP